MLSPVAFLPYNLWLPMRWVSANITRDGLVCLVFRFTMVSSLVVAVSTGNKLPLDTFVMQCLMTLVLDLCSVMICATVATFWRLGVL